MILPKILNAGVYRHAQRSEQTIQAIHLALHIRGAVWNNMYYPDGTLCSTFDARKEDMTPHLSIATRGFRFAFEFDSTRENWVIIIAFPAIEYHADDHRIYWNYQGHALPLPQQIPLTETECSALRQTFSTLCQLHRSALPQNMLESELMVLQILQRFLQSPGNDDDDVELLRRRLAEDTLWKHSIAEHCRFLGANRDRLRREFTARYKIAPGDYRIQMRLHKIFYLLAYSDLSFKEIAFQVGMKNQSHLSAFIRERCGKSPSELKRGRPGLPKD
ncbi:MAG: helix-turn-helix domain-containing protein [Lentisphaeria bacterium]|nr:helix-turn-helix domain-containing protein [Lentisphaeria bacterium]